MKKINYIILLATILMLAFSVITFAQASKASYPDSNPFKKALGEVPQTAIFSMDGYYLWDPSVIKVGDTYHLFASRWPAAGGMQGWKKSQVIRATSKSLFGPYQFAEVVLDPSTHPWATGGTHNPKILKVGKRYLLYHLGIPQFQTGFAFADAITGPWKPVAQPVIKTNNPSLMVLSDSSIYCVGKFKPATPQGERPRDYMQAFKADHLLGPYQLLGDENNRLPDNFELEDPCVWWANNRYNVVCTDWKAKVTGIEKAVVLYTSKDGINYQLYSPIPVWSQKDTIPMQNGGSLKVSGIERPQVYTDDKGAVTALLGAIKPSTDGPTYIIIRPVDHFIPRNK